MKKILLFISSLFLFLLFDTNVNAEVETFDPIFVGYGLDSEWTMSPNSSITGTISYMSTQPIDSNFAFVDVCTTGNEPDLWITENINGTIASSTDWYKVNTACNVMGQKAQVYRQIMYIVKSDFGSCGEFGTCYRINSTGRFFNATNGYTTYMRLLHIGLSNDIPLNDIILDNGMTQTELLRDILSSISNNDSTMQGVLESNQAIKEQTEKLTEETEKLNNSINNNDTSDASNEAGDFFSGFSTDTFGLTSIITAPLNLIGSITSSSCSPLGLEIPFVENSTLNLPCMSTIYQNYFGSFLSIYQTITFGIVAYWVCVRIFALVKDFKNPDHDEIEVLDL